MTAYSTRSLTPDERFALYEDLYSIVLEARRLPGDWSRLDTWRWREKVAHRLQLVDAFRKLDQLHRERPASNDTC